MLPGEHQQVLSNLQSRLEDFLEDSQESQIFSGSDVTQLEKEVNVCRKYYQELLKSAERGKVWGLFTSPAGVCSRLFFCYRWNSQGYGITWLGYVRKINEHYRNVCVRA